MVGEQGNLEHEKSKGAVAFAIVCGAGFSTAIGASIVFFPSLVKLASPKILAGGLGLSAGVMIYVSLTEISTKSQDSFVAAGLESDKAFAYSTLSFFGGLLIMMLFDVVVKWLSHKAGSKDYLSSHNLDCQESCSDERASDHDPQDIPYCIGCIDDPVKELKTWKRRAEMGDVEMDQTEMTSYGDNRRRSSMVCFDESCGAACQQDPRTDLTAELEKGVSVPILDEPCEMFKDNANNETAADDNANKVSVDLTPADTSQGDKKRLLNSGITTAVAIALHNFPEGLATFTAAMDDVKVGAVLAVAIAIHNIPEGLCIALPVYYATGSRWKGFLWGALSGVSEPFAALLGWAFLANSFSNALYACLFGIVSGMMVIISLRELIPTAHRYDPKDTVVTYSIIAGLSIMALSLVLFTVTSGN